MSTLTDDLKFARKVAEAGLRSPLLGGRFLLWWGAMVGLAYAIHYLLLTSLAAPAGPAIGWLWICFGLVSVPGYLLIRRRYPFHQPGSGSQANRAERAVWAAAGLMLLGVMVGAMARVLAGSPPQQVFPWTVPAVFGAFAIAQLVTGWIAEARVLQFAGFVALIFVAVCFPLVGQEKLYATASAGVFATVFLPGFLLWRNESAGLIRGQSPALRP